MSEDVDVVMESGAGDEGLVLTGPWGTERIGDAPPVVREALRRMQLGPVLLANLEPLPGGSMPQGCVYFVLLPVLDRLSHLVVRTLGVDDLGGPLLSVCPVSRPARFTPVRLPPRRPVRMPRGVSLTVEDAGFALESEFSPFRVVLHRPEAALVAALLAWPVTPDALSEALPLPREVTQGIVDYLAAAGMAAPVDDPDVTTASRLPVRS
ncbi:NADH oxidase [Streptomyces sp. NPDC088124]|uniref:NADH oxidase n=1 Tax=Streptomyces sp. NPDC088124 TaxID=3154654 RepID=UPI0034149A79